MKARITTVLSLVGVLSAGSAAALVNTQVLQSAESKSGGDVTVGSTDGSTSTTTTATGDTVTKIQSDVLSATQAMYQIGDAGLVTLDAAGDVLTVVSVTPNSGWTVVKAENIGSADIEVKLQNGTTLVEFRANLEFGVISTSVESRIVGSNGNDDTPLGSTPIGTNTPGIGSIDDDDDDDDVSVTIGVEVEHDDGGHGDDDD